MPPTPSTPTAVLIATLGIEYVAPARMPRELRQAGCTVAMLAPAEAWCTQSRFLDRLAHLPASSTYRHTIGMLDAAIRKYAPKVLLPGDDAVLTALMQAALEATTPVTPPAEPLPAATPTPAPWPPSAVTSLVEYSLGNPAHYAASLDKARLVDLARAAGIAVPPGEAVTTVDDAVKVAKALGYPVILRPTLGTSSKGVATCNDERELRAAMLALPLRDTARWPFAEAPALVQRFLAGTRYNRASVAWRGREIAGYTRTAVERWPNALGAGSVVNFVAVPAVAQASAKLAAALGMSGFAGTQFIDDPDTGLPCLIEINRRIVPATHVGRHAGIDLAQAFVGALQGIPWTGPSDTPGSHARTMVMFPQEWKRDPQSVHLRSLPVDAPWDDPRLFAAMLGVR
jgi:hypothetical protein